MKEKRAKDLLEIEPPASIARIARFLQDLGHSLDEPEPTPAIGAAGVAANQFARRVASRVSGEDSLTTKLLRQNQVAVADVLEFNFWLKKWTAKRAESETLDPDDLFLLRHTVDDAPRTTGRRRERAVKLRETIEERETAEVVTSETKTTTRRKGRGEPEPLPDFPTALSAFNRRLWLSNFVFGAGALGLLGGQAMAAEGMGAVPGQAPMSLAINQFSYYGYQNVMSPGGFPMVGGMALQSLGRSGVPQRDILANAKPGRPFLPQLASGPVVPTPQLGQITLVAPPVAVASRELERKGAAISFDWRSLRNNVTQLDEAGLQAIKEVLPDGAQALYPALPEQDLGPSAVNLPLAPELVRVLLDQGYGNNEPGLAESAAAMALTSPVNMPLFASLIPTARPAGWSGEIFEPGSTGRPHGLLHDVGGFAQRGGVLDFLGLPIRLAPGLTGQRDLRDEMAARSDLSGLPPFIIRPNLFARFNKHVVPGAGSVIAEPDRRAWTRAASQYGIAKPTPARVLSPAARVQPSASTASVPQIKVSRPPIPVTPQVAKVPPPTPAPSATPRMPIATPMVQSAPVITRAPVAPPVSPPPMPSPMPKPAAAIPHQLPAMPAMPTLPHHAMEAHAPEKAHPHEPKHEAPLFAAHKPALPVVKPQVVTPTAHVTQVVAKPQMPLAKKHDEDDKHLAIQASTGNIGPPAQEATEKKSSHTSSEHAAKDQEIHLLANEVWSILKQRIAYEAERSGRA
jgi:hypothetical protein